MFDPVKFGSRVQNLRLLQNLTQQQFADALNISLNYTYKLENGSRTPSIDLCIQISILFKVSLDYLLTGEEAPLTAKEAIHKAIDLLSKAETMVL